MRGYGNARNYFVNSLILMYIEINIHILYVDARSRIIDCLDSRERIKRSFFLMFI